MTIDQAVTIEIAEEGDAAEWDAFVRAHPDAEIFHLYAWARVIAATYGYAPVNLIARRGGAIAGVLALTDVRSALFGRSLISTAFTVGGGILTSDAAARRALADAAVEEGRRRNVRYVELRARKGVLEGWPVKSAVYAGFEKELPADEAENLKMIPRRRRATVRKAIAAAKNGALSAEFNGDVDAFYALYAQALRDLGTPIFPKKFVRVLMAEFSQEAEILVIAADGQPVLALLSFYFGKKVMPYYFGARADARAHRAYDYAIWLQMRRGADKGATLFDFGRSKYGTGSFDYKSYWGFEAQPLEYQYALIGEREAPNISPSNPKFSAASAAWKRLPLGLANTVGPMLARHLA